MNLHEQLRQVVAYHELKTKELLAIKKLVNTANATIIGLKVLIEEEGQNKHG